MFSMRYVTLTSRLAPTSMSGMYTNFTIPPSFKIEELVLTLGPNKLFLV